MLRFVKGYRHMLGLSQEEMAHHLGITKQAYHNKETGKNSFTDNEKLIIRDLLKVDFPNITVDDIFFR